LGGWQVWIKPTNLIFLWNVIAGRGPWRAHYHLKFSLLCVPWEAQMWLLLFHLFLLLIYLLEALGFELSVLPFWGRSYIVNLFFLQWFFLCKFLHFCLGLASDHNLPTRACHTAGITGLCHYAHLVYGSRVSVIFYPTWPQTMIFLISVFWVAGIAGLCHHTWPCLIF
jgi:hypothetical protein